MDKINPCNSSVYRLFTSRAAEHVINERIANSFVTKIEACHYPDDVQRKTISSLLEKFCCSDSIKEVISIKKQISRELNNLEEDIHNMREQIFSIVNRDTDQVYGVLKKNFTTNDRDQYVKKLMYHHEVQRAVTEITGSYFEGNFAITVPRLGSHHSNPLWGDMAALQCLMDGVSAKVPDLTYNVGSCQFG